MSVRGTTVLVVLVFALIVCGGCVQPDKTVVQAPSPSGMNSTPVPVFIPAPALPVQAGTLATPVTLTVTTVPAVPADLPPLPVANPQSGGFVRFTGPDYSLDYPAAWAATRSVLPLREYRHTWYDCSATNAYNLDQELRMYYSRDGGTLFYTVIVKTDRDIWPRTVQGRVVYEDIVNAVLGNPEQCANREGNKAFTIAGISRVPLAGVSYPGVRADFAKINLTGFTDGTGTVYVVTGKEHSGVFTFYRTSADPGVQADLATALFGSLQLDSGF